MIMFVKHVFYFDVSVDRLGNFFDWTHKTAKPFYKKFPGVKSFNVYRTIAGKPSFTMEVEYENLDAFNNQWQKVDDPQIAEVMGGFFSFAINLESRLITQVT